jgi:thiosulfate dehydrogenase (quinone) large subunit
MQSTPLINLTPTSQADTAARREFLVQAASMLGFALSAGTAISVLNGCETTTVKPDPTAGGTNANTATINIAQESALQAVGGATKKTFSRSDAGREVVIIRSAASQFLALSAICTHSQCSVELPVGTTLTCLCHGSRFSAATGKVLNGPAPIDLKQFATAYDAASTTLTITF